MLFGKKSKAPPPAAPVSYLADGEPDMRGLGRLLWREKAASSV